MASPSLGGLPRDRWVLGAVVLGLVLRIVYALALHGPQEIGDQLQYIDLGHNFKSWWESTDALRTPGYPFFVAVNVNLGLGLAGVRVTQAIALSLACYAAALMAGRLGGVLAARVAAIFTALFPPLVTLSAPILSDALATSLFVGAMFALVEGYRRESWLRWLALSSAFATAATLVRPNLILGLPIVLAVGLLRRGNLRRRAFALAAVGLPVLILFTPWVARNYHELHRPAPLGVNDGPRLVFAAGVHLPIDTTGGAYGAYRRSQHFYDPGSGPPGILNINTAGAVGPWHTLVDNIEHRPFRQIAASAFWQRELWLEAFDDHAQYGRPPVIPYSLSLALQFALVAFSLAGLWLARRELTAWVVLASAILLALPFLVHLPEPRYAAPQLLLLTAPAALAAAWGWTTLRARVARDARSEPEPQARPG